jgi:prophage regulatory protein
MNNLPEIGYLRLWQIIGNNKTNPPTPPLIPISKSTWWEGVKTGRFPKPVKLGARITVWRAEDIRKLINNGIAGGVI